MAKRQSYGVRNRLTPIILTTVTIARFCNRFVTWLYSIQLGPPWLERMRARFGVPPSGGQTVAQASGFAIEGTVCGAEGWPAKAGTPNLGRRIFARDASVLEAPGKRRKEQEEGANFSEGDSHPSQYLPPMDAELAMARDSAVAAALEDPSPAATSKGGTRS